MRVVTSLRLISIMEQSTCFRSQQVAHLYKKYPILFGIRRFTEAHTAARHGPYRTRASVVIRVLMVSPDISTQISTYVASSSWITFFFFRKLCWNLTLNTNVPLCFTKYKFSKYRRQLWLMSVVCEWIGYSRANRRRQGDSCGSCPLYASELFRQGDSWGSCPLYASELGIQGLTDGDSYGSCLLYASELGIHGLTEGDSYLMSAEWTGRQLWLSASELVSQKYA
jgi:hypothetical protein